MAKVTDLIKGFHKFHEKYFESGSTLYKTLTEDGQSPKTLVIACSDSRVDPAIITSAKPGDLFISRNVANLVPPCENNDDGFHGVSAVLEFAVKNIEIEHIVILGHSNCAGIKALVNSDNMEDNTDFIGRWMNIAMTAKERAIAKAEGDTPKELEHRCEKEGIIHSLENLMTFPWIAERVNSQKLSLHGWYFTLEDGKLSEYDLASKSFKQIK